MKQVILFFAILFFANSIFAQDTDKTLVKSMDPKGTSAINFEFRNKGVESEPWDENFIRVELEITANFPEAVLAQLVKAGRYSLTSSIDGEVFNILAQNLNKAVTIGGKDLDDHVRLNIKTPGYYAVSDGVLQKNFPGGVVGELVGRAATKEEVEEIVKNMRLIKEKVDIRIRFVYKKDKDNKDKAAKKADKKASAAIPSETRESNNSGFIQGKKETLNSNSSLREVQGMYGDILIGGMSLENFND